MNKTGKKPAPPPMPQIFQAAAPLQLPVKRTGILGRIATRLELLDDLNYYTKSTAIVTQQNQALKLLSDNMMEALTFGPRFQDTIEEYAHRSNIRQLNEEFVSEAIAEKRLQNQMLTFQVKQEEVAYRIKEKEAQRLLEDGDVAET